MSLCAVCQADISYRSSNAIYCLGCAPHVKKLTKSAKKKTKKGRKCSGDGCTNILEGNNKKYCGNRDKGIGCASKVHRDRALACQRAKAEALKPKSPPQVKSKPKKTPIVNYATETIEWV